MLSKEEVDGVDTEGVLENILLVLAAGVVTGADSGTAVDGVLAGVVVPPSSRVPRPSFVASRKPALVFELAGSVGVGDDPLELGFDGRSCTEDPAGSVLVTGVVTRVVAGEKLFVLLVLLPPKSAALFPPNPVLLDGTSPFLLGPPVPKGFSPSPAPPEMLRLAPWLDPLAPEHFLWDWIQMVPLGQSAAELGPAPKPAAEAM